MNIDVEDIGSAQNDELGAFLAATPAALLYHSPNYRRLLEHLMPGAESHCFAARIDGRIAGILPAFLVRGPRGAVLNSLPFFGSNGGILAGGTLDQRPGIQTALREAWDRLASRSSAVAATVISNPIEGDSAYYDANWPHTVRDSRIGQISPLPTAAAAGSFEALMAGFHQKTRNCVRKAQKSDLDVSHEGNDENFAALVDLHTESIRAIGGTPKAPAVFDAIRESFVDDRDYRLYVARKDGRIVAALLVFYFNRTAEYFTPATLEAYRVYQPMSLLIVEAMRHAMERGMLHWNWGGTWLQQTGVYQFKSRWGTVDKPYHYYTQIYDPRILRASREQLLAEYPYTFVVPFSRLIAATESAPEASAA